MPRSQARFGCSQDLRMVPFELVAFAPSWSPSEFQSRNNAQEATWNASRSRHEDVQLLRFASSCCKLIWRISAKWKVVRPVDCSICSRQLKPSAIINVESSASLTAGNKACSPHACDIANLSLSYPKAPAIPQHPDSSKR